MTSQPKKEPRSVYFGILAPGERIAVALDKPLATNEQPLLIVPTAGQAIITSCRVGSAQVEILSKHDHGVPYSLIVAPRAVLKTLTLPWREMVGSVVDAAGQLFERLKGKP